MTSIINRAIVCERVVGKTRWDKHMSEWRGWLEEESKKKKKLYCWKKTIPCVLRNSSTVGYQEQVFAHAHQADLVERMCTDIWGCFWGCRSCEDSEGKREDRSKHWQIHWKRNRGRRNDCDTMMRCCRQWGLKTYRMQSETTNLRQRWGTEGRRMFFDILTIGVQYMFRQNKQAPPCSSWLTRTSPAKGWWMAFLPTLVRYWSDWGTFGTGVGLKKKDYVGRHKRTQWWSGVGNVVGDGKMRFSRKRPTSQNVWDNRKPLSIMCRASSTQGLEDGRPSHLRGRAERVPLSWTYVHFDDSMCAHLCPVGWSTTNDECDHCFEQVVSFEWLYQPWTRHETSIASAWIHPVPPPYHVEVGRVEFVPSSILERPRGFVCRSREIKLGSLSKRNVPNSWIEYVWTRHKSNAVEKPERIFGNLRGRQTDLLERTQFKCKLTINLKQFSPTPNLDG